MAQVSQRPQEPIDTADEGDARFRASYLAATYERLARVKRRFDPDNVFRGNHNIRPA